MGDELVVYLQEILNLEEDKVKNIIGVFNDYSTEVSVDNCFSYGKGNEVNLADATLTQLVGTNGVGKSSIPLILEEVFNKNSKNVKKADIANRYIGKGYDISLDFSVDDDLYNISAYRGVLH